ncbi:LacI family DNA-binding transcriptional regulator [Novosphingobium sp. YAF33]|uniref:LacI family DNA-binding transcriptional regulator n=1 Tax=Novosphingobium sp. YAF33 TaxID=3233082 RepID=UPI003F95C741
MPPPRLTMDDVARLAGVSRKTVSRLVNGSASVGPATRARILAAMKELGFDHRLFPLPGHAADPAMATLALFHDGSDPALAAIVETAILEVLDDDDPVMTPWLLREQPLAGLKTFLERRRPQGAIFLPPLSAQEDLAGACADAGTGCARLGHPGLACDDRTAMAQLVHWLSAEGHRRIGLVSNSDNSLSGRLREQGFLDAIADRRLTGPLLVVAGDGSCQSGRAAAHLLFDVSPRPSAIIAATDEMAAGVLQAAVQAGLAVPQDLSVAGFEDMPIAARTAPALTSMRIPWAEIAREAISRLTRNDTDRHTFAADLVVRESVRGVDADHALTLVRPLA